MENLNRRQILTGFLKGLAGGIERFVGYDDAVVLKPNGQWPRQGYTHTESLKALIDIILSRPGGFSGEVIIAEHVHRPPPPAADNALGAITAGIWQPGKTVGTTGPP